MGVEEGRCIMEGKTWWLYRVIGGRKKVEAGSEGRAEKERGWVFGTLG